MKTVDKRKGKCNREQKNVKKIGVELFLSEKRSITK